MDLLPVPTKILAVLFIGGLVLIVAAIIILFAFSLLRRSSDDQSVSRKDLLKHLPATKLKHAADRIKAKTMAAATKSKTTGKATAAASSAKHKKQAAKPLGKQTSRSTVALEGSKKYLQSEEAELQAERKTLAWPKSPDQP